jgi:signal transduction histidine kinase
VLANLLLFTLPRNRVGFSPVDLRAIFASAWKLLEIEAKKQGNIRYCCDGKKPVWVNGNKQMLQQAVLNLLKNALEAMPHGGEISVSVITKSDTPPKFKQCEGGQSASAWTEFRTSGANQSGNIRILITDTGIGMGENELARMFDPYFTTKTNGRGIGLVICHNIIRLHGGKIVVSSRKNRGTEICVELPPLERGEISRLSAAERSGSPDIPSVRSETEK